MTIDLLFIVFALLLLTFLAFVRYNWATALVVAILPSYLLRFSIFGIPTTFLELAILTVLIVGLFQPPVRHTWKESWRNLPKIAVLFLILFVTASLISTFISPHLRTSLGILKGWIIIPLLFGWAVYSASRQPSVKRYFIQALILSGTVVALLGISQLGTINRVRAVFDVPNSLALFLAPILVLTIWQSLLSPKTYSLPPTHYQLFAAVMAIALVGTQSIGGIGAVAFSLLIGTVLWLRRSQRKRLFITIGSAAVIVMLVLILTGRIEYFVRSTAPISNFLVPRSFLVHRSFSEGGSEGGQFPVSSLTVRLQLWSISWDLIKQHPLLGIGLGTFEPAYQEKLHERFRQSINCQMSMVNCARPLAEWVFRDPHNLVLSFWLNTGLLGLLSFAAFHVWLAARAAHLLTPLEAGRPKAAVAISPSAGGRPLTGLTTTQALLLALLTIFLFGLVDTVYWKNDLAALHWILIGLLFAPFIPPPEVQVQAPQRLPQTAD